MRTTFQQEAREIRNGMKQVFDACLDAFAKLPMTAWCMKSPERFFGAQLALLALAGVIIVVGQLSR